MQRVYPWNDTGNSLLLAELKLVNGIPKKSIMTDVANLPMGTMTRGRTSPIWRKRKCLQAEISSLFGSRLPGGRHFTTLVMKAWSLCIPASERSPVNIDPALPTNGLPSSSSFFPGASPMHMITAGAGPSPETTCVRERWRSQRVHPAISSASLSRSSRSAFPLFLSVGDDMTHHDNCSHTGIPVSYAPDCMNSIFWNTFMLFRFGCMPCFRNQKIRQ